MNEVLRGIPFFAAWGDLEANTLVKLLQPRSLKTNEPIFWIGEQGTDFCIVRQGQVVLTYPDETGKDHTPASLGPGDFFGKLSLLDGGPRTATWVVSHFAWFDRFSMVIWQSFRRGGSRTAPTQMKLSHYRNLPCLD